MKPVPRRILEALNAHLRIYKNEVSLEKLSLAQMFRVILLHTCAVHHHAVVCVDAACRVCLGYGDVIAARRQRRRRRGQAGEDRQRQAGSDRYAVIATIQHKSIGVKTRLIHRKHQPVN